VFSQNRGRRGSDELLRQALTKSEADRELCGRAYITLKGENQDLLRENRDLKQRLRVVEAKCQEVEGKYKLSLEKIEGMVGAERERVTKMSLLHRELNDLRARISRN